MKHHALIGLALLSLAFTACNRNAGESGAPTAGAPAATAPATTPAARKPQAPATPEEIAQIEASGKTGLWSDVTEVCRKDIKKGIGTTLTWNVKDKGANKVVLYVIGKNGVERNFGSGGPVGRKQTGPWLVPGLMFRVRDPATKADVGSVTIGEKQC